jgi:predicted metal-dependent HD superfamily phosphohydrolase
MFNIKRILKVIMKEQDDQNIGKVIEHLRGFCPEIPYHNFSHTIDVWNSARQYAKATDLNYNDRLSLELAALFHDSIIIPTDAELESARYAASYLGDLGYSTDQVTKIGSIILATTMPQQPKTYLEKLICDADLDGLGRPDLIQRSENLRKEWDKPAGLEWLNNQVAFLEGHEYHTEIARKWRNAGKAQNVMRVKDLIRDYEKK